MRYLRNGALSLALTLCMGACGDSGSSGGGNDNFGTAFWAFDEASGATARNSPSNGLDILLTGVGRTPGKIGNALLFDDTLVESFGVVPVLTGCLSRGCQNVVDFPDSRISIDGWIRAAKIDPGSFYMIFGAGASGVQSFLLTLENGMVVFYIYPKASDGFGRVQTLLVGSTTTLAKDTWYHIGVTYDGSTAKVYVNGQLDATRSITYALARAFNDLYVGGRTASDGKATFPGAIDELRLSNSTLTDTEMLARFQRAP
jgi:hypothetical protein